MIDPKARLRITPLEKGQQRQKNGQATDRCSCAPIQRCIAEGTLLHRLSFSASCLPTDEAFARGCGRPLRCALSLCSGAGTCFGGRRPFFVSSDDTGGGGSCSCTSDSGGSGCGSCSDSYGWADALLKLRREARRGAVGMSEERRGSLRCFDEGAEGVGTSYAGNEAKLSLGTFGGLGSRDGSCDERGAGGRCDLGLKSPL
mmetsp:Transcript_5073/g.11173  ORF Transcript_5073/g.11173 Transcript_5073/m.11173 type:complete len:201 (+) Transcript_5073:260-862(+)